MPSSESLSLADIFLSVQICAIGLHVFRETRLDGQFTSQVINSLPSLHIPFALHTKHQFRLPPYGGMTEKFNCLIHVILLRDDPIFLARRFGMNSLLKRFNRDLSSENDYVLVITLKQDRIRMRTVWESPILKRITTRMFPYNALPLELHDVGGKGIENTWTVGYFVEQNYQMRFYCNKGEQICWKPSWPQARLQSPPLSEDSQFNRHQTLLNFPTYKRQFDQLYSLVILRLALKL